MKSDLLKALFFAMMQFSMPAFFAQEPEKEGIQIKEVWIQLSDGTELAADLYLPEDLQNKKYPVILEYLPYRKDEGRGVRYALFSYFVKRGYVVARVDIRGTGRSKGHLVDGEYSEQEQLDGVEVIDWLAKQSFSTGNIAMLGISWGGFNGLHLAMRHPPALKTVISLMSTDDIYEDDVHFMDGLMHVDAYEIGQDLSNALPGAPDFKIDEEYFKNRFDTDPWFLKYKKQQTDGPFWDRASLNENYEQIDIPVFVIGGWYDGYRDFIPRFLENADVLVKAMLGPWNHTWPNWASPEPAIEWRETAVRWLDHWLKGIDNGVTKEPSLIYYQRDWHAPGLDLNYIPGVWKSADLWPETKDTVLFVNENHLLSDLPSPMEHQLTYKPSVGVEASGSVMWWGDWSPDQKVADQYSLNYDSAPLKDSLEIIGFPRLTLRTSIDASKAHYLVRLSDVSPDGSVTQITGAGYNANHIISSENPVLLVKDSVYTLTIELHVTSWTFRKGHKIRLSVNNAQWPMIWPSPYPMTTKVYSSEIAPTFLSLPVSPERILSHPIAFTPPESDPQLADYLSLYSETLSGFAEIKEITRNEQTNTSTVVATNSGSDQYPWGIMHYTEMIRHEVSDSDPAKASVNSIYTMRLEKKGRMLKWLGDLHFHSDENNFYYQYSRKLYENDDLIREKFWIDTIPRR
ncbi:MAG: CocE/NonD family hydrolase [Lutimonas sp.]